MIELIIFDLDGLLADTEKLHMKSYQNVLADMGYHNLSDEIYAAHWIRLGKGIVEFLEERKLNLDIELIRKNKAAEYNRLVKSEVKAMPGAEKLLQSLRDNNMKVTLATASYSHSAKAVLETLGFEKYFQFIASKESIQRNKPFPDIFLLVAEKMKISPEKCLVLEDAEKGVLAAFNAGMKCIAIPNQHTKNNDFSKATLVLSSLEKVSLDTIKKVGLSSN